MKNELYDGALLENFPIFKTPVRNLVRSSCLVALEHVSCKHTTLKKEFPEISRRKFLKKRTP